MSQFAMAATDGVTIARRNLIKVVRVPEILVAVLVTPLMFVLMFAYVLLHRDPRRVVPRVPHPALTLSFGATFTGAGLAEDMQKGIIDRFRSLPMSRAALVVGRTVSDVLYNVLSLAVMSIAGLLVGWRIHGGIGNAVLAFGLLLLFAYAISWVMAWVGLVVPSPEVVNNASMMVIFPMTFVANTFAPSANFPTPLRIFAEWNPVSAVTQAARELFGNIPAGTPEPTAWSLQHPALYTLGWVVVIIAVFAPLAVRRYGRVT